MWELVYRRSGCVAGKVVPFRRRHSLNRDNFNHIHTHVYHGYFIFDDLNTIHSSYAAPILILIPPAGMSDLLGWSEDLSTDPRLVEIYTNRSRVR
jgi:hypothetical protein